MATTLQVSSAADGIVTVAFDLFDKPVNILSLHVLQELDRCVATLERQKPRGVIFTSGKPRSFIAGADLVEMQQLGRGDLEAYLTLGQSVFDRISKLGVPTVAALNGDALGGGLELALACGARVAADDRTTQLGLVETKVGLVPGFGGTVRLPALIGLEPALGLMLDGKTIPPAEALRLGMVDEVAPRESLMDAARRMIASPRPDRPDQADLLPPTERNQILDQAQVDAEKKSKAHYPAPVRSLEVVRAKFERGLEQGLANERKALGDLIAGDTARNLIRGLFLRQGAKKLAASQAGAATPITINRAAVIGGGTMGSGIAHALVRAGIDVSLIEATPQLTAAADARVRKILTDDLAAGRMSEGDSQRAGALLHAQDNWQGIGDADIIVEAVAEDMSVKRAIFMRLEGETRHDAVLASNTSSLSIASLAECTSRPQSVIGLHFFNPVPRMPLLEIVRTGESSSTALATAVALGARLGKSPFIANDSPGFVVNGVLIPYLSEAYRMAGEGVPIDQIDRAIVNWGWPMGPFTLSDHIGLDVIAGIFPAMASSRGERVVLPDWFERMIRDGRLGRKTKLGFYDYENRGAPPITLKDAVSIDDESIQWRLMLMMGNEAAHVLEDGVVESPDSIDLSVLLGLAMAPWRGGIVRWIDSVGTATAAAKLNDLAAAHGRRFAPSRLLSDLAMSNRPLSEARQ